MIRTGAESCPTRTAGCNEGILTWVIPQAKRKEQLCPRHGTFSNPESLGAGTAEGVAALVFDATGKTNLLDGIVLEEIEQALTFIEADQRFQLCILRSKKGGSFCHGVRARRRGTG